MPAVMQLSTLAFKFPVKYSPPHYEECCVQAHLSNDVRLLCLTADAYSLNSCCQLQNLNDLLHLWHDLGTHETVHMWCGNGSMSSAHA